MKNALPEEMQETLLLVAQLFATQPQLTSFPNKPLKASAMTRISKCRTETMNLHRTAPQILLHVRIMPNLKCRSCTLQHLVKVPHLAGELARASGGNTPLAPLLRALLPSLASAQPAISTHAPAGSTTIMLIANF